jgi:signal transduction histidine kinase
MPTTDARCEDARAIQEAAHRAAALTRQLLTFSRKQKFRATVFDLNVVVEQMHRFLGHLLGDDIVVVTIFGATACLIRADETQVEQVLMNLILNARDAMPNGGRLSITTANIVIQSEVERLPDTVPSGSYVHLSVSDTGEGMARETIARAFEPYFTRKDIDKDAGVGLSLVHGIVARAGGYIAVESEPGMGATFDVYLPRAKDEVTDEPHSLLMTDPLQPERCSLLVPSA